MRSKIIAAIAATMVSVPALAADLRVACPVQHLRVVRSTGITTDYLGSVPGIPELCHLARSDGNAEYYLGSWRADWPGAGQAYPALRAVLLGSVGAKESFITRSVPGWQWTDSFINEGVEPMVVDGRTYQTLKVAHERNGIEGNSYHSIITSWRDVPTGVVLRVVEDQIAGDSYGPGTTWTAVKVEQLP
jgi:hypothetical protein